MSSHGVYTNLEELLSMRHAHETVHLPELRSANANAAGDVQARRRGRGMEFEEVRPYQAGDDIRNINWRVTARTGNPTINLFNEETEHTVFIALDQRVNMFFGSDRVFKSVLAARIAAQLAWSALAANRSLSALIAGNTIEHVRDQRARNSVLQLINRTISANHALSVSSEHALTLVEIARSALLHSPTGAAVFIVSDFIDLDSSTEQVLATIVQNRSLHLIQVQDPLEISLPAVGNAGISDGTDVRFVHISSNLCKQFEHHRINQENRLESCVAKIGARLLQINTHQEMNPLTRTG